MTDATDAVSKRMRDTFAETKRRVEAGRAELERLVEDNVGRALTLFSTDANEVRKLHERLAELESRAQALQANDRPSGG
jgi:tetrahydromethanopterin S-methyltransferase subunit G